MTFIMKSSKELEAELEKQRKEDKAETLRLKALWDKELRLALRTFGLELLQLIFLPPLMWTHENRRPRSH